MNSVSNPNVSVVIPNYNHARFLRRRVDSVLNQSFRDFEVILLDDCSTDESRSILREYAADPRVRIEFNEENSGSTFKQWNKGARLAQGKYIWIAESDDYADGRLLERLVSVLDAEPETALAYCRSWRVSADDRIDGFADIYLADLDATRWTADYSANGHDECSNYFMSHNIVPNASAMLFRKSIFDRVGGSDETLRLGGDWKLWASMALTGNIAYLGEPLNYYRFHENSVRGRDPHRVETALESLQVVRWIQEQVTVTNSVREKSGASLAGIWLPPVLNAQVPLGRRWSILRSAMAVDPRAMRRLLKSVFQAKFWHPVLGVTRPARQALGLRQKKVRPASK